VSLESSIADTFRRHAKRRGVWVVKMTPEGTAGLPDRICFAPYGRVALCELKQPGKKAAPLQKRRVAQLRRLGFHAEVIDRAEDVPGFFDRWLEPSP